MPQSPKMVDSLIELEKEYGHEFFIYGLSGPDEYREKYDLIVSLMESLENTDPAKGLDENGELLLEMLSSHICSPEAAAYILINHLPDSKMALRIIETHLKSVSMTDHSIFAGYFYKNRMEMVESKAASLIHNMQFNIQCTDTINTAYIRRYAKDTSLSGRVFSGKGAVYTVITGGYDLLDDPKFVNPDWDYICFTDRPENYSSKVWDIRPLETGFKGSPVLIQKYAKFFPWKLLKDYDYSIYIDGKICITGDMTELINSYSRGASFLCFPHPGWQTLRQEAKRILELKKGDPAGIMSQVEHYETQGYDNDNPLAEGACLIRSHHDPVLTQVMEDWWNEVNTRTTRDQLSLGYVCKKNSYNFDLCALNLYRNDYLAQKNHL